MKIVAAITPAARAAFELKTVELEAPRADEILVRIEAVGLCHTDIVVQAGDVIPLPGVLGHEGAGVVEAVGNQVTKVAPGDRVVLTFRSCGHCRNCNKGLAAYCHTLRALNYAGSRLDGTTSLSDNEMASRSPATFSPNHPSPPIAWPTNATSSRRPMPSRSNS
jgi:aryl-alcohol dehydrogenase